MSASAEVEENVAEKRSPIPLLVGAVVAVVGGGAGFWAVSSGLLFGSADTHQTQSDLEAAAYDHGPLDIAFVPLDQIIISLTGDSENRHLMFRAELEVPQQHRSDVELLRPRIIDVLNGYLRALEPGDLEGPAALVKLRAQMLRRAQLVTGQGRVRDLLVIEFVLN